MNGSVPIRHITRDPAPQPGQQRAIELIDRDVIVSAGAGSGKTWVLTERYIEMLNYGTRPEQIIAITFTKKAAAEMKGRIRQAIAKMEETSASSEEAAYWNRCKRELERAVITTIHGFCTRLLKDAPLEAGVDPAFHVLDEKEAVLLEREVFAEAVDTWLQESGARAERVYRELGDRHTVIRNILALHRHMRTYHVREEDILSETFATLDERKERFHAIREELLQLADDALACVQELLEEREHPPNYLTDAHAWLTNLVSAINRTAGWDGTYERETADVFVSLKGNMWRNTGPDHLKALHGQLKEKVAEWLLYTEAPAYRELLRDIVSLTTSAAEKYREAKRRKQGLDFHDLEQVTTDMLSRHPEVAERWRQTLHYVMVDEFQDTNSLQKDILDRLIGSDGRVKQFVVGDGKQSIYQFRGADVAVFNRTDADIRQSGGAAVSLDVNFRTQHRLIHYINSLFAFLMQKEEGDPDYAVAYEPLVAHRKPPHDRPAVELLATAIPKDSDDDARQMEAERVARRIRLMVEGKEPLVWEARGGEEKPRPVEYRDIALLLATRTHLDVYEQALLNEGIPYTVVGGRGFYRKQEVLDVLNVLKFVQNRDDELALLGFLRSPFVHLSDETLYWLTREQRLSRAFFYLETPPREVEPVEWERLLQARERYLRWEQLKQTDNVYRLMRSILDDSGYISVLLALPNGEQAALNVEKLLDIARESDGQGLTLFDFLARMETLREEGMEETEAEWIRDRGNAMVIMTVHASKGLEFPVVVLPDLSRNVLQKGALSPRVLYAPGHGLAVKTFRESGEAEGDGLFDSLSEMARDRELKEAYRLFYVAVTRARDYLLLAGSQKEQKRPSESMKHQWLDWVVKHLGAKQLSDLPAGELSLDTDWSLKVTWELDEAEDERREDTAADTVSVKKEKDLPWLQREGATAFYPLYAPLDLARDAKGGDVHSVSALMDYTECPRLYVLKHCLKMPQQSSSERNGVEAEQPVRRLTGIEVGNVLHRVMERVEQEVPVDELIADACQSEGFDFHADDVVQTIHAMVDHYRHSEWFAKSRQAKRVWNELPFHYRIGSHTVTGVIDKLFVDVKGEATLLDFKTNWIEDENHLDRLAAAYTVQVQMYAAVVQELLQLPVKQAILYFLQGNRPVEVEVNALQLEQKKREWEQALAAMHRLSLEGALPPCTDESCHCRQYLNVE